MHFGKTLDNYSSLKNHKQHKTTTTKKDRPYDMIDHNKFKDFITSVMQFSQEKRVKKKKCQENCQTLSRL